MELGAEISQKIRSAIKAKLVDLGAYVDDELPDYIMVMVANKKNVQQMTADLNLFLGNNTDKFTVWLTGLLDKLQAVTTENEKKVEEATPTETEEVIEPSNEPVLQVNAEPDAILEAEDEEAKALEKVYESLKANNAKGSKSAPALVTRESHNKESRTKTTSTSSSSHRHGSSSSSHHHRGEEMASSSSSRKRKMPSSTVVPRLSSRKFSDEEEVDEEEYDPLNPSVGKVASVIRVTERKSSVPLPKQANKSLLMKAMHDAQASVSTVSRVKVVRPMRKESSSSNNSSSNREVTSSRRRQRISREEDIIDRRTVTAQPKSRPIQLFSKAKREEMKRHLAAAAASAAAEDDYEDHRHRRQERHDNDEPRHKVQIMVKPQTERVEVVDIRVPQLMDHPSTVRQQHQQQQQQQQQEEVDDEPGMEKVLPPQQEQQQEQEEEFELVMGADGLAWQDEDDIEVQHSLHGIASSIERAPSPKFVVTLDGVENEMEEDEDEVMREIEQEEQRNVVRVQPMRPQQPVVVRLQEEDGDSDHEGEESPPVVDAKKVKSTEKCRFFPNCKNGEACPYNHPTTPCTNFPNCRFGEKCLYMHPKCKFDASCTRANCAFSHTTPRGAAAFALPSPVPVLMPVPMYAPARPKPARDNVCRFYPRCNNVNCTFTHPKPCRFGVSCSRKSSCSFSHPALPAKDKMRWSAAGGTPTTAAAAGPKSPTSITTPSPVSSPTGVLTP